MNEQDEHQARFDRHQRALLHHCIQVLESVDAQLLLAFPAERLACSERQEWCLARLDELGFPLTIARVRPRSFPHGPTILDTVEQTRGLVRTLTATLAGQTEIPSAG